MIGPERMFNLLMINFGLYKNSHELHIRLKDEMQVTHRTSRATF